VLCICEHFLTINEVEFYGSIGELKLASIFCRSVSRCGGTALYIHSSIEFSTVDVSQYCAELDCEIVAVFLPHLNIICVSVYHSPSGNFENFCRLFEQCLCFINRNDSTKVVIAGDFNVNFIGEDPKARYVTELLKSYGLYITCKQPTRGPSCLDNVAVNLTPEECHTKLVDLHGDDHEALVTAMCLTSNSLVSDQHFSWRSNYLFSRRVVHEDALMRFRCCLASVSWDTIIAPSGESSIFERFFWFFQDMFNFFFPETISPYRPRKATPVPTRPTDSGEWFTPELSRLRGEVLALKDICDFVQSPQVVDRYRRVKAFYKSQVSLAKKNWNARKIDEAPNKCKAAWDLINANRALPKCKIDFASPDEFNSFFVNSVRSIVDGLPQVEQDPITLLASRKNPSPVPLWSFKPTTPSELVKIVRSFKPSRSPDVYGMSTHMLRLVVDVVSVPLSAAINECLTNGCFPAFLKTSRIIPVYKKGDHKSLNSFRPIAIVPTFGKVIEAVIKPQLEAFFETHHLFSDMQFGFRRRRSTVDAAARVADRVGAALEDNCSMSLTLCDLSRAFDSVSHTILEDKLHFYGLQGPALGIIRSYLQDRTQCVAIDGATSRPLPVDFGVPQGSILGPTLFLVMINDLDESGQTLMFADDTTLLATGRNGNEIQTLSDQQLQSATNWFLSNKFQLNEDKTQRIVCSLSRQQMEIQAPVKLLGFVMDKRLNWESHVEQVTNRLSRVCFLLLKLRYSVTENYLIMVYHALFHCHITYGLLLWGHSCRVPDVLRMQKRALRIITSSDFRASCRPLFARLNIFTVVGHFIFLCILNVKRNQQDLLVRGDFHDHNTRQRGQLDIPRVRLARSQAGYAVAGIRFFNKLPVRVQQMEVDSLKSSLARYIKRRAYYSVDEFLQDDFSDF
jgi:hypothetical protein